MVTHGAPRHDEGVIKFTADHVATGIPLPVPPDVLGPLTGWRTILWDLGLIGQAPARYGGAGFGNVSARVSAGAAAFWVTGTQTGGRRVLGDTDVALVEKHDVRRNRVASRGPVPPSSESMTHGAIYEHGRHVRWVFHVHSPVLWKAAARLELPRTPVDAPYGTPEMAAEVDRLFRDGPLRRLRVLSMDGHEDGIVSFGTTAEEAGTALLAQLARALSTGN
ncbi:MAG: class II aldolase/adducin family protein [Deltaproteobacteria bacterium]|nr:class II aldolase/adducin family protein [Deltaproteobacteria bacterium]